MYTSIWNQIPGSKQQKLFEALCAEGKITAALEDMFWGSYFGTCKDKYGVQWMFNCNAK